MSYLENNLDALERVDAPLAYRIRKSKHVDFSPRKYCNDSLKLENGMVLCGFSSIDWPQLGRYRVEIVDESSARLIELLKEEDLTVPIQNKEIEFNLVDQEEALLHFSWRGLFKKKTYLGEERIINRLKRVGDEVHSFASEYRCLGKRVLGNVKNNLMDIDSLDCLSSYRGRYSGGSALVCGSSEELFDRLSEIKECEEELLIIAAGSSLIHLDQAGVKVAFSCMVDPDLDAHRYEQISVFSMPMFCQLRLDKRVWQLHQGRKIHIPSHGGWAFENMLCRELGLEDQPFDGGLTSGSMAIEMAHILGCSQIIVIGMESTFRRDLADTDRRINEKACAYNLQKLKKEDNIKDCIRNRRPILIKPKEVRIDHRKLRKIIDVTDREKILIKKEIETILQEKDLVILESELICFFAKLEGVSFFQLHLKPLWHIFRALYKKGDSLQCKLQEILFYKSVLEELDEKIL